MRPPLGTTTSTSWTDSSPAVGVSIFAGSSEPDGNTYSFMEYWVNAYNSGILAASTHVFFQGSANGPGGTGCNGGGILPP
jgi:hypothetical protein